MLKKVRDLQPGDMVDLEDDPFHENDYLVEYEYGVVDEVKEENPGCFLVTFTNVAAAAYHPDTMFPVADPSEWRGNNLR